MLPNLMVTALHLESYFRAFKSQLAWTSSARWAERAIGSGHA